MPVKKKLEFLVLSIVLVTIAGACVLVWPLPFSSVISDETELMIVVVEINADIIYDNGMVNRATREYIFPPDSSEFVQMRQVLSTYSYHRSFRTFFGSNSIPIGGRFYLDLHSGEHLIATGGNHDIKVDGRVYQMGYGGHDAAFAMADAIKAILDASAPSWEANQAAFSEEENAYR